MVAQLYAMLLCRAAEVVRDHPGVMVMVDHCGTPYEKDPESMRVWREGGLREKRIVQNFIDFMNAWLVILCH